MPNERNVASVAAIDNSHYKAIRQNVSLLMEEASRIANAIANCRILDIAPQDHGGIAPYLSAGGQIVTLDIDPTSGATVIGDICVTNPGLKDESFDVVICTEVLEHVNDPFAAVAEIHRILTPGGWLFASSPFDFRIHGPLPDNWRFTEHGWRVLLERYSEVSIRPLENPHRPLAPIHYAIVARR